MKALRIVEVLVQVFITLPIWFFLLYTILAAIHPDRLVWFLFYSYVPFSVFANIVIDGLCNHREE